jgi:tRNA(Arg) A34 adenosine deaminase TadA
MENKYIQEAIKKAREAFASNEVPIGAVIVDYKEGRVIATGHNMTCNLNDATAHAEIVAIRKACKKLGNWQLNNCDIYVSLEPCPMCAQAISIARIRRLYFAAYDTKSGGVENGARVYNACSAHHKPEIYGGICESEASDLMKDFFRQKR